MNEPQPTVEEECENAAEEIHSDLLEARVLDEDMQQWSELRATKGPLTYDIRNFVGLFQPPLPFVGTLFTENKKGTVICKVWLFEE